MENKINKNTFEVLDGGKKDEPTLTKKERRTVIEKGVRNQDDLGKDEKLDLVKKINQEWILGLKKSFLSSSGRMLSDEEAIFMKSRLTGLALENQMAINELHERFPDLIEEFNELEKVAKDHKKKMEKEYSDE